MKSGVVKLALIGCGQLGSRHLQALTQLERPAQIEVVEPDPAAVALAQSRLKEMRGPNHLVSVKFFHRLRELSPVLDLAIIATTSSVRQAVLEELLAKTKVRYLLLEKVLFQSVESFGSVRRLLSRKKVKAWVNCPRRIWPFYRTLKSKFHGASVDYRASGSRINLGSVAVHLLDHLTFFTDQHDYKLSPLRLDNTTVPAKRPGFIEFTGTLEASLRGGSSISITSYRAGNAPFLISLTSPAARCLIREPEGKAWLSEAATGWDWREILFTAVPQSQLTQQVVGRILETGNCELPTFAQSAKLHIPLLKALMAHLRKIKKKSVTSCPIT